MLGVVQVVMMLDAVSHGFGKSMSLLGPAQISMVYQVKWCVSLSRESY